MYKAMFGALSILMFKITQKVDFSDLEKIHLVHFNQIHLLAVISTRLEKLHAKIEKQLPTFFKKITASKKWAKFDLSNL